MELQTYYRLSSAKRTRETDVFCAREHGFEEMRSSSVDWNFVSLCIRFVWTGNARRKLQHSNYRRTEDILVNGHLPTKLHFLIDSIKWFYIIHCTCFVVRFYHIQSFVKWNNQYNFVSFRLRILETACRVITYYVTILMKTVTNTQHDKTVLFQDILCIP